MRTWLAIAAALGLFTMTGAEAIENELASPRHDCSGLLGILTCLLNPNDRPNKPSTPTGPTSLRYGEMGRWCTSSNGDPDGDTVLLRISVRGDGVDEPWTGADGCLSYRYLCPECQSPTTYPMKAVGRDTHGADSPYSDPLHVTVSP